jgi:hypothetical protein
MQLDKHSCINFSQRLVIREMYNQSGVSIAGLMGWIWYFGNGMRGTRAKLFDGEIYWIWREGIRWVTG